MTNEIAIREEMNKNFLATVEENFMVDYSPTLRAEVAQVFVDINNNKTLPEMYGKIVSGIPMKQSTFQDVCVQLEQHFTPHRKMKQLMLEMDGKIGALDAAKNGCKQGIVKLNQLREEIETLQVVYDKINVNNFITYEDAVTLSMFFPTMFNPALMTAVIAKDIDIPAVVSSILSKLKNRLGKSIVKFDETDRGLRSHQHMIKDSALSVVHLKNQVDKYQAEIDKTGWSFEESELVYYVMYFTKEAEQQLRTGGRVDTGTYGVVSSVPLPLQKKIHSNWEFLEKKMMEDLQNNVKYNGYYFQKYNDIMMPTITKDEDGKLRFEGITIDEIFNMEDIGPLKDSIVKDKEGMNL